MGNLLRARKGPRGPEEAGEVSLEDACSLLGGTGHPRWIEAQRDRQREQNSARGREEEKDEKPLQKNLAERTKEETAGEKAEKRRHRGIKMAEK